MSFLSRFIFRLHRGPPQPEMQQYESEKLLGLQGDDETAEFIQMERARARSRRFTTFLTWIWRLVIACLSLWAFINISLNTWHFYRGNSRSVSQPTKVSCSCGNSVADAVFMGCKYDALASAWLPPACIDAELSYEFDHAGPEPDGSWVYYTDYDKTGTYTLEEVSLLADTGAYYYNTMAWHLAHCTYNWRKAVRSKCTGVTLEYRSDTEEHVKHCEMMFKDRTPLDYVGTVSIATTDADWHEMHQKEMHPAMHPHMHPDNKMHPESKMHPDMHPAENNMHPSNAMHPHMHPNNEMHPNTKMHPAMHPDNKMHPNMHPAMHPDNKMHPAMHPDNKMHPNMHPAENMHPAMHPEHEMHPSIHLDSTMHPESQMHPGMHPDHQMHPAMHQNMHPNMHPEMHADSGRQMHPDMHPDTY